ncbi:hypothetical protein EH183_01655 [Streptomyces sp. CB01881]|nr:hypothetical protein EH183_01655 [Streptomyces sp. CB01881]
MATTGLTRGMGRFFEECEHPESRWSKCPHEYKIRYRNAAGRQTEVGSGLLDGHELLGHEELLPGWRSGPSDNGRPIPAPVEQLIADGLVVADTSTSSYRPGHLLSLTPQGEAARSRRILAYRRSSPVRRSLSQRRNRSKHHARGPTGRGPVRGCGRSCCGARRRCCASRRAVLFARVDAPRGGSARARLGARTAGSEPVGGQPKATGSTSSGGGRRPRGRASP